MMIRQGRVQRTLLLPDSRDDSRFHRQEGYNFPDPTNTTSIRKELAARKMSQWWIFHISGANALGAPLILKPS